MGFINMKLTIGQTVFYTKYNRGEGYSDFKKTVVTKIGKQKFETALNGQTVFFQDSSNADNRGWIDNHYSNNHNRYFQTIEEANQFFEGRKLRRKILDLERSGELDELNIEQLRKICKVF